MNYRTYLEGGTDVSVIGFGAWQLGVESGWKAVSEAEADRMIRTALDHGINFFDTASTSSTRHQRGAVGQGAGQARPVAPRHQHADRPARHR